MKKEDVFRDRYAKLNEEQRKAVDTVYGPVMVIAGPGTGKTEVLAMRIAALLRSEAQVQPYEILCLTFTDEATVAMRRRLLQIIGEEAHRIHIYTFHAFCNHIIQANMEYFGRRELMPVSDLERMEMIYGLIEELPEGHVLRRLKGNLYYDARYMKQLFDLMKSEAWTSEAVSGSIDHYLDSLPERETFIYKRANAKKGIRAGDLKTEQLRKEQERMERTRAAARLFDRYQERMLAAGRYDFNDMILWVLNAFREYPDLLLRQQERFQFILADEFQDTSGAQSELLYMLADYWEDPNLFVVGDDDQSIFEFQGARMENILEFYEKHRQNIKMVVLKNNYRSSQVILDRAMQLIGHNEQRLIRRLEQLQLDKDLTAANDRFFDTYCPPPRVIISENMVQEQAGIVAAIEELQDQNVPLSDIAVLYAQHKQADPIITLLEKKGIPYSVKKPVNILDLPLVTQILDMLRYLDRELIQPFSGEPLLFRILHAPFTEILPVDVASLSMVLQQKDRKHQRWRYLLQDSLYLETLGLIHARPIYRLGMLLENWLRSMQSLTLPMFLEDILYDSGMAAFILNQEDSIWNMQVVHTFFDFVKEETGKAPRMSVAGFLAMVDKMYAEDIQLPIQKITGRENGVRFYTAFGAKGHEFEHVFVTGLSKQFWEEKPGGTRGFALPDTLTKTVAAAADQSPQEEVSRRLFYVAMTRAKKYLSVSFSEKDNKGKELEASRFIDEISRPEERVFTEISGDALTAAVMQFLQPAPKVPVALARKQLLDQRLEHFVLSVSAMNRYLRCPLAFYYEYILGVPQAKSDALGFGIAVHSALEQLFRKMMQDPERQFPGAEVLLNDFRNAMRREESAFTSLQFERRMEMGRSILLEYYRENADRFNKVVLLEYNIPQVSIHGVPARGKLDKIEFDGKVCTVIDYKTGSSDHAVRSELNGPDDLNPNGGDYWRQMIFYQLLLANYPPARGWKMTAGIFEFIEKNKEGKYVRYTVPVLEQDIGFVRQQIRDVYNRILNHEFDTGCGKEDCYWCRFAETYTLAAPRRGDRMYEEP